MSFDFETGLALGESLEKYFLDSELLRRSDYTKPDVWGYQALMLAGKVPLCNLNKEIDLYDECGVKLTIDSAYLGAQLLYSSYLSQNYKNAAFVTAYKAANCWAFNFCLRYNAKKIDQHLTVCSQFLKSAKFCLNEGLLNAFLDNAYSSCEILAKTYLLDYPDAITEKESHKHISQEINKRAKHKADGAETAKLLNRLSRLRQSARYLNKPLIFDENEISQIMPLMKSQFTERCKDAPLKR
ncbi:MAG: HEPN domain-containing protein [Hyphomicrobiales bacterium]|nr:HEPN domain-containing protein [Hyphomicrobiales bacterium]